MMQTAMPSSNHHPLSHNCLTDLYLQKAPPQLQPVLQILGYQASEYNSKQIVLRVSDQTAFVDCMLVGPYALLQGQIVSTEYSHSNQRFKTYDLVKVIDYFVKIDPQKICPLRIIIRKVEEQGSCDRLMGVPQEIAQLIENRNLGAVVLRQQHLNSQGSCDTPIKIQEQADEAEYIRPQQPPSQDNNEDQPLTLADIMDNKPGYFIGRLVRMKAGSKEAKDGPMSFLYLGFVDSKGELVRVNLAGRIAIRQSRQLRKGKCYYVKGLQLFQGQKGVKAVQGEKSRGGAQMNRGGQIRLREKDYRIQEISNEAITSQYLDSYFKWQHQNEWVESQTVDVIGLVADIQQRITYRNANTYQQTRDVVRLVIYNSMKTVKISFWADHIHILESMNLRKKQPIILQDIKKKKNVFLDFTAESNIIVLDNHPELREKFDYLLPPEEEAPQPNNVQELLQVHEMEPYSSKIRVLRVTLLSLNHKWLFYRMCNHCKKKVQRHLENCPECNQNAFVHKYNCPIQFADSTGTLTCVGFDPVCQILFRMTADELSQVSEAQVREACTGLVRKEYRVSIQNKNSRLILRNIQETEDSKEAERKQVLVQRKEVEDRRQVLRERRQLDSQQAKWQGQKRNAAKYEQQREVGTKIQHNDS